MWSTFLESCSLFSKSLVISIPPFKTVRLFLRFFCLFFVFLLTIRFFCKLKALLRTGFTGSWHSSMSSLPPPHIHMVNHQWLWGWHFVHTLSSARPFWAFDFRWHILISAHNPSWGMLLQSPSSHAMMSLLVPVPYFDVTFYKKTSHFPPSRKENPLPQNPRTAGRSTREVHPLWSQTDLDLNTSYFLPCCVTVAKFLISLSLAFKMKPIILTSEHLTGSSEIIGCEDPSAVPGSWWACRKRSSFSAPFVS